MNRGEPTLAPEWLKGSGFSSSHSDEHGSATLLRNRLVVSAVDNDAPREASSSFIRSSSSNGYSNFGSRHRDRDRYNDSYRRRDREKDNFLDNDFSDFLTRKRNERDTLRRSHSMVSGRRVDTLPKRLGSDSKDRGSDKVSFDNKDFPSLGTEEKQGVSSFMSSGFKKLNINTDGWTSALAEVPTSVHTNSNMSSTVSGNATSLSMAEALVQAPPKAHTAPLVSNENERRKELALMYNKLIPVTPQGPKNLVEKSKLKGNRNGDAVTPKAIHPPTTNPDALKTTPQPSKLIVLNRDLHNNSSMVTSPTAKDGKVEKKPNGGLNEKKPTAPNIAPSVNSANPTKPKANGMSRDRNNFFNSLREKAGSSKTTEPPSSFEHSNNNNNNNVGAAASDSVNENMSIETKVEELVMSVAPNEEEKAFLVSLGWNENANDDALTAEEIQSWIKKNEKKLAPNFKARLIGTC